MSAFWNIAIVSNSRVAFTVNESASTVLAVDVSSNLVDWTEFARFTPQNSPLSYPLEDTIASSGQRFYRAVSNPIELQVGVQASFPLPAGTIITAAGGNLVVTQKEEFNWKTFLIGTRFLPASGQFSIAVSPPGFIAQTQTVSATAIREGGQISFYFTDAHSLAPTLLPGLAFDYSVGLLTGTIAFSTNGASYLWLFPDGTSEAGYYSAHQSGSLWTISTINTPGSISNTVKLRFASSDTGTLSVTRSGSVTTTNAPFTLSTSARINPNQIAPATISSISIHVSPSSYLGEQFYSIVFSGNVFTYIDAPNRDLTGTFEYTVNGPNTARLVMHYAAPIAGDLDDLTPTFNGLEFGTISGASIVFGQIGPYSGTFSNFQPVSNTPPPQGYCEECQTSSN